MVEALVRVLSTVWAAVKARAMTKAAAELPQGEQINKELAANEAELEKLAAAEEKKP